MGVDVIFWKEWVIGVNRSYVRGVNVIILKINYKKLTKVIRSDKYPYI